MNIKLLGETKIEGVPSGSGLVKVDNLYYVIGDDSPYLYCLNNKFAIISKTILLANLEFSSSRIEKSEKPDFETLEMISENELVVFGSGSKSPQRDHFIRILLKDTSKVERYDLTEFYNHLRKLPILKNAELNIEATAYHNNQLFLFNRKKNLIIDFDYQAFLKYLKGTAQIPHLNIVEFKLPEINGVEAGFSGATVLKSNAKMLFTATVENTNNAYDDGAILGSFVGVIDLDGKRIEPSFKYSLIPIEGQALKVESVSVADELANSAKLIFVTDDDKGNSIILKGLLKL